MSEQVPDCEMGHQMRRNDKQGPGHAEFVHYWPIDLFEHTDQEDE